MMKTCALAIGILAFLSISCKNGANWNPWAKDKTESAPQLPPGGEVDSGAYSVEGILDESEVFLGGLEGPKRYLLRDPETKAIKVHVQAGKGCEDLDPHVGALVRVVGKVHQEPVGLVVEAQKVKVLEPWRPAPKVESAKPPSVGLESVTE